MRQHASKDSLTIVLAQKVIDILSYPMPECHFSLISGDEISKEGGIAQFNFKLG